MTKKDIFYHLVDEWVKYPQPYIKFFEFDITSGMNAKNSEKTQKNRIAQLLDEWGIYGAIFVQNCPSKCLFNFIFYLKKVYFYTRVRPLAGHMGAHVRVKNGVFCQFEKKIEIDFLGFYIAGSDKRYIVVYNFIAPTCIT